jgi:hypothetical protein
MASLDLNIKYNSPILNQLYIRLKKNNIRYQIWESDIVDNNGMQQTQCICLTFFTISELEACKRIINDLNNFK